MDFTDYYISQYDSSKLEFLKKHTRLGVGQSLNVYRKKLEAEKERKEYLKSEPNDLIAVDEKDANLTEYLYRMKIWENKYEKIWENYGHGMTLGEYSMMTLNNLINEERRMGR